jgi:hypothetical protein
MEMKSQTPPAPPGEQPNLSEADRAAALRATVKPGAQAPTDPVANLKEGQLMLTTKGGKAVVMGYPGRGTAVAISRATKEDPDNGSLYMLVKALCYVRSIDGQPQAIPQSMTDVQNLCNLLGEGGEDEVFLTYNQEWGFVTADKLNIVKNS